MYLCDVGSTLSTSGYALKWSKNVGSLYFDG
jgi:hypothetical protein